MPFENVKCTKHQRYECPLCIQVEGPVAKSRRLEADNDRLRGLVKQTEDLVDGCPWCHAVISHDEGMHHRPDCPAFTADGNVK